MEVAPCLGQQGKGTANTAPLSATLLPKSVIYLAPRSALGVVPGLLYSGVLSLGEEALLFPEAVYISHEILKAVVRGQALEDIVEHCGDEWIGVLNAPRCLEVSTHRRGVGKVRDRDLASEQFLPVAVDRGELGVGFAQSREGLAVVV